MSLSEVLNRAGAAANEDERRIERAQQYYRRRADATHVVMRAKADDGRTSQPVTAHDAQIACAIAELLDQVAGAPSARAPARPDPVAAEGGSDASRQLNQAVESAIMARDSRTGGALAGLPVDDAEKTGNGA